MSDFFPSQSFQLGRGINLDDAPELIDDAEALELVNFRFEGHGRWTTRFALAGVVGGLVNPCGVFGMPHGELANGDPSAVVYLDFDQNQVKLYKGSGRTDSKELVGTLAGWESVDEWPVVRGAVLAGCLWLVDESRNYGLTCYDPDEEFGNGVLFQPKFKFAPELDTPPAPILARDVETYNNFLVVCGYGDEAEPDQAEILRFSYLGLAGPDAEATQDAALDVTQPNPDYDPVLPIEAGNQPYLLVEGGVEGLFDVEDYFPVGQRKIPIMGMTQGAERLVICTRIKSYIMFGYDRNTFEVDLLDGQRGLVATRAIGEADGVVYWMSPLGPCRWQGGNVIPMSKRMRPLFRHIAYDLMFFHHHPSEHEARWYYSVDGGFPNRSVNYSYQFNEWRKDQLGVRVSCGGHSIPGTILRPGPGGEPIPPPPGSLVPPRNLHCESPSDGSITFVWIPGETGVDVVTETQWRKVGDAAFRPLEEWPPTTTRQVLTNLEADTEYEFEVRHRSVSGGETSTWVGATCETLLPLALTPPTNLEGKIRLFVDAFHDILFWQLRATWVNGELDALTLIEFRNELVGHTRNFALLPGENEYSFFVVDEAYADELMEHHPGEAEIISIDQTSSQELLGWRVRVRHRSLDGSFLSPWSDEEIVGENTNTVGYPH